jgi:S1-C subfamily serine protease
VSELLRQIAQVLYDQEPGQWTRPDQIYLALPGHDGEEISNAVQSMKDQRLIQSMWPSESIKLSAAGRDALNDGSIVEQTLGMQYVAERYGPATVHIIVTGTSGENAGSGFFSADFQGWIVTAAHVLLGRDIVRIENLQHEVVARPPLETRLPPSGLLDPDLALIRCDCPDGTNPIRIEWRRDAMRPMETLLVLGYPAYPLLHPNLAHITAELNQVGRNFTTERESLVLSSPTLPGSSGGPVLSRRGRVVGVVEQENMTEQLGEGLSHSFTATPALYLAELWNPNPDRGPLRIPVA